MSARQFIGWVKRLKTKIVSLTSIAAITLSSLSIMPLAGTPSAAALTHATRIINSVTVNNGTAATAQPNAALTANLTVTVSPGTGNDNFEAIAWAISPSVPDSAAYTCDDFAPNHTVSGTYPETITLTAPNLPGTYNAYFIAYQDNHCEDGASDTYVMPQAVTVQAITPSVTVKKFNTHSGSDYQGINVGFRIADFQTVTAVSVSLYQNDRLLVTNSQNDALLALIATGTTQLSTPFIMQDGTYTEQYWQLGNFNWTSNDKPTKAVISVTGTDTAGTIVTETAVNENFVEPNGWTFESLLPPDITAPSVPQLSSPADHSRTASSTVEFNWYASTDDSNKPVAYEGQLSHKNTGARDGSFLEPLQTFSTAQLSIAENSLADGTYFWHVRAVDAAGNKSPWSITWEVVVTHSASTPAVTQGSSNGTKEIIRSNASSNGEQVLGNTSVASAFPVSNIAGSVLGASTTLPSSPAANTGSGSAGHIQGDHLTASNTLKNTQNNATQSRSFLGLGWWWLLVFAIAFAAFYLFMKQADRNEKES